MLPRSYKINMKVFVSYSGLKQVNFLVTREHTVDLPHTGITSNLIIDPTRVWTCYKSYGAPTSNLVSSGKRSQRTHSLHKLAILRPLA